MSEINDYFATCSRGVEDLVAKEFSTLGLSGINVHQGGVSFTGKLIDAYRACLWTRVASRVLLQLREFTITSDDDLYEVISTIDWSQHFTNDETFTIDCYSSHTEVSNSHYATLRIKDAIVDQFQQTTGDRPSIARENPDIRLNAYLSDSRCLVYLDLSGEALHKRGYRLSAGSAPLRETLAAAMLYRARWPEFCEQHRSLVDPMCGSGTLLIEAALMATQTAPGLLREQFGFSCWRQFDADDWKLARDEALARKSNLIDKLPAIVGCDQDAEQVKTARKNIDAAGLSAIISVYQLDATSALTTEAIGLSGDPGLIITNPPYGKRIGQLNQLRNTYSRFARQLKLHFDGWTAVVITSEQELAKSLGLRAFRKNALYNGAIKSTLYQYHIRSRSGQVESEDTGGESAAVDDAVNEHAVMFANRLKKNDKHLRRWARKNDISCYRVYDADIPQYAVAIDRYEDWVHVQEYQAPKSVDRNKAFQRINDVIDVVADILDTDEEKVVLKVRRKQEGHSQYEKQDESRRRMGVRENGLKFLVNMHDYIDTGLFLDHRITRSLVRKLSADRDFLNLFAYTGSFSVYAAAGGAASTTTVDMSNTYLDWARDNMSMNGFSGDRHRFIREDCLQWISHAIEKHLKYQLIFIDPPTFSNSKKMSTTLDINRDHSALLSGCLALLSEDGIIIFSTNSRSFKLDASLSEQCFLKEITSMTTSEDFRRKPLHRCWCLAKDENTLKACVQVRP